jgi:hypothetical protein
LEKRGAHSFLTDSWAKAVSAAVKNLAIPVVASSSAKKGSGAREEKNQTSRAGRKIHSVRQKPHLAASQS